MTLNPYEVYVTPSALDNWRALADESVRATEHYSAIKRTLRQAVEMSDAALVQLELGEDYDPKRLYYVADSPTRGRLVFVLRPNNPTEGGHTLTRVLKEQSHA